jgi:hypothetical protein
MAGKGDLEISCFTIMEERVESVVLHWRWKITIYTLLRKLAVVTMPKRPISDGRVFCSADDIGVCHHYATNGKVLAPMFDQNTW